MADRGFRLTVLTGARAVLDETVESIVAPGSEGYLGVLRQHAPLVTALVPGKLTVTGLDGAVREFAISGGFLEVRHNVATVLADALEPAGGIDVERAERAADRARKRLAERDSGLDVVRAEAALARSLNRLRVAKLSRRAAGARGR
jgi:F-type H+-transporting ATPase subunit epsilon